MKAFCRYCAKPMPKRTERVRFGVAPCEAARGLGRVERPANKAEAQRYVNGAVVSTRRSTTASVDGPRLPDRYGGGPSTQTINVPSYISEATYWDGESYVDPHFCTNTCAIRYARMMALAEPNKASGDYWKAVEAEKARAKR